MMTNDFSTAVPYRAVHPMELVKDEVEARGMTKKEFAERLGIHQSNLSRLFRGESPLTAELASKIETALGIPADYWMRLHFQYDRDRKNIAERDKKDAEARTEEIMLGSLFNMKELYSSLRIRATLYVHEKMAELQRILRVPTSDIPSLLPVGAFKKSEKLDTNEKNLNTWLLLAYASASKEHPLNSYADGNALLAANEISERMNDGSLTQKDMKAILGRFGISYSVVANLSKVPVDAFSTWKLAYPAIISTNRFNDMSRLVFNVLHELGHISMHLKQGEIGVITNDEHNKQEEEANRFASDELVPPKIWTAISRSAMPKGFADLVPHLRREADKYNLSQDVVIWRYKHDTGCYNLRNAKAAPIR